ncbi:MAG: hypothetical protein JSV65_09080 [Armatimonadota bacterium]|nr:MAG: hypothetical protein JSV65_09080 [Armatimonadota bacterium]
MESARPILWFYSWATPTLSFGRLQHPAEELLRRCREAEVPAVRRPTGGKAILHHREVTFSIIASAAGFGSVIDSYRIFARAIAAGLARLGVEATLCEPHSPARDATLLCFAAAAECDLEVDGKKLVGSAQARRGGALLQQNSLPLALSHELKGHLFGEEAAEEARIATDLTAALSREPSFGEVRDAIVAGFEQELGAVFESSLPSPEESQTAESTRQAVAM